MTLIDPFDNPQAQAQPAQPRPAPPTGGLIDPFDDVVPPKVPPSAPETSFLDQAVGVARDVGGFVAETVTGKNRTSEELPEFRKFDKNPGAIPGVPDATRTSDQLSMARSDLGKLQILKERLGYDVPFEFDEFGNAIVTANEQMAQQFGMEPGQRMYLNRPGASAQDFVDTLATLTLDVPLAAAGGRALKNFGLVGRAVGTGTGAATGSVAQDVMAGTMGSREGIDPVNALVAGAAGVGFEFAAPLVPFIRRLISGNRTYNAKTGELTREGREALIKAGIDPDVVDKSFVDEFRRRSSMAGDVDDAAAAARQAEADEFGVPLSRGDATQDFVQQQREDIWLKTQDTEAGRRMGQFRDEQTRAIESARDNIRSSVGGESAPALSNIDPARDALSSARDLQKKKIREAYDAAAEKGGSVMAEAIDDLVLHIARGVRNFNPSTAPKAFDLLRQLRGFRENFGGNVQAVNVKTLEQFRQQVSALERSNDTVERMAASEIRKQFDGFMENVLDEALIRGDEAALEAYKKARSMRVEFRKRFEGDNLFDSMLEVVEEGDNAVLKMEPSQVSNKLFGVSQFIGSPGAARTARRMKAELGEDSAEWTGLRQEAFIRLFPEDATIDTYPKRFKTAMERSPELMRAFFSRGEIDQMKRFSNVVRNARIKKEGAVNYSNTGVVLARIMKDMLGFNPQQARAFALGQLQRVVGSAADTAGAVGAVGPNPVRPKLPPPGIVGGAGAVGVDGAGRQ